MEEVKPKLPMQRINLVLDFDLYVWCTEESKRQGVSRNEVIRQAIKAWKEKKERA